eukprot:7156785-Prymnesium_polylepis.1
MHDVLTAVALLRQSKSTDGHAETRAETALYTAEDTSCMLVGPSNQSPDMIYIDRGVDPVKHVLAYGSPVKAL